MSQLTLSMLGQCQVVLNEEPIRRFRTQKVKALLLYLATEPHTAHRREKLMALFWPGMPESSARSNLRQILFHLRQAIPDIEQNSIATPLLIANRQTIQLNPRANIVSDTAQFEAFLAQAHNHSHLDLLSCHTCQQTLKAAAELYKGDFLADFYLDDSNQFEEWAEINRQRFRRKMLDTLDTLTTTTTYRAAYDEARIYAERQLEIDDLHESAYRQLMEVLALSGQRASALSIYESYRRLLAAELGMAPATRTTELYEKILAGEVRFGQPQIPGVRGYELKEEIGAGAYGVIHRAVQPAIGREVAIKVIHRRYANDPAFIRRFEAEAQIVARLEHPHIVPLYDYWREPGGAFLVMRLLRGGNLLTKLQNGPWTPKRTSTILDQIAPALFTAHRQGIVHRDIKPANILFDEADNAYLSDFGIAKDLTWEQQPTVAGGIIGTLDYISPEQLQDGAVSPQSDIYSLGAVLYEILTGEKPFANLAPPSLIQSHLTAPFPLVSESQPGLQSYLDDVIQRATAKRPQDRFSNVLDMAEMFSQTVEGRSFRVTAAPPHADGDLPNPYKGLRAYQEADASDFFGREKLIGQLIDSLSSSRFMAIVGPSGSGKSSLVKAGLIPALRRGALPNSDEWYIAQMEPGSHPLEELEFALWPIAVDSPPNLVIPMQKDSHGLLRTIRRVLPDKEDAQLLLFIDQFEELFTMVEDEALRNHFLESLYIAISAPHTPLRLVVTLRADFYDRPLQYQPLADLFKQHTELVLPLKRDELIWAIQEPVRRIGVTFEDGLLPAIVADVDAQPGSLPLLQYALTELFARRHQRQLTTQAYADIGGVPGALARRADAIFTSFSPARQEATRQLFLRLVSLGEWIHDTAVLPNVRRRVRLSEAQQISNETGETTIVLNQFGEARLLTFDRDPITREPTVEVAHEALLIRWERLRGWLAESRTDLRLQRQLATASADWQENNREKGYLLRGAPLTQFEAWRERSTLALLPLEADFLQASLDGRLARQSAEAARGERELETARQLAETEKQRAEEQTQAANQLRRRAVYLTGALIIVGVLVVVSVLFREQSIKDARVAISRELAAAALNDLNTDPERSTLLALKALEEAQTLQAEEALHKAVQTSRLRQTLNVGSELWSVAYGPDGRFVATGDANGDVIIWDVSTGEVQRTVGQHDGYVNGLAYNSDGTLLASAGDDNARVWNPSTGEELLAMDSHTGVVFGVSFSPDDALLVTSSWDGTAKLWDIEASLASASGQEQHTLSGHTDRLWQVSFNAEGSRVATSSSDGSAKIWDVASGIELLTLQFGEAQQLGVQGSVFSKDGTRLVTVGGTPGSSEMSVWDTETGERLYQLSGHPSVIQNVAISPDGSLVATAGTDSTVRIWDFSSENRQALFTLSGHKDWVNNLAFSPDGRGLATVSRDGTGRVWDISNTGNQELLTLEGHKDYLDSISFSPDGRLLATGSNDGTARLWDLTSRQTLFTLRSHEARVNKLAFSPDGTLLATAGEDNTVRLWDVASGQELRILRGHTERSYDFHFDGVMDLSFSTDGSRLATAGVDGQVKVWDVETGAELLSLSGHPENKAILSVAFSPDGNLLAAGTDRPSIITIWDGNTGEELMILPGYESNRIFKLAFGLKDDLLAVGNNAGQMDVLRLPQKIGAKSGQGAKILFSIPSADATRALAFNKSGTRIITGGRLWDAITGQPLLTLYLPDEVGDADFSPDGNRVAIAGLDGLARLFTLDLEQLIILAQSRVTRSLTTAECQQYLHMEECPMELPGVSR